MAKFFIKKRISLSFLGEDYKDSYIVFKTVPVAEYEVLFKKNTELTNIEATSLALSVIKDKFIEGKMVDDTGTLQDISVKDIDSFMDEEILNECYLTLLGQKPDPKS